MGATGQITRCSRTAVGTLGWGRVAGMALMLLAGGHAWAHPDLTGVWMSPFRVSAGGGPIFAGQTPWTPASKGDPARIVLPSVDQIIAMQEADRRAGRPPPGPNNPGPESPFSTVALPLTPAGRAAAAKLDRATIEKRNEACYPHTIFLRLPGSPVQIVQNERAIALISEEGPARTVFMDGRRLDDALPQWNGMSVGHWRGDTLVIETAGLRGGIFNFTDPLSDHARLTEEYHLSANGGQLIGRMTLNDPTYYTEPLRRMVYLDRRPDLRVLDYQCEEGKDDMVETLAHPDH